jgi:molecular chaperone GrpE
MPEENKSGQTPEEDQRKSAQPQVKKEEATPFSSRKEKALEDKKSQETAAALEKALADSDHWKNEYYRVYADTQNLRKSLEADHQQALRYRAEGFVEELLPVLDSFYIALGAETTSEEAKNYRTGFQYIYNSILSILASEGISEIPTKIGDRFDATDMHAVDTIESEGEENLVVKILAKGYRLHDRLIRPVVVAVSKKPVPKTDEKKGSNGEKPVDDKTGNKA